MRPTTQTHPSKVHDTGTAVAASLVLLVAAVGLVLVAAYPVEALAVGAGAAVATIGRRAVRQHRRPRATRRVCIPATDRCIDV